MLIKLFSCIPIKEYLQYSIFVKLSNRFRATGDVAYTKKYSTTIVSEENEFELLEAVIVNPNKSSRKTAKQLDVSRITVSKILKTYKYHPYHLQHHQLYAMDYERRVDFCMWALNKDAQSNDFFNYVLFTDESTFHNNGLVNRHNFHCYDTENHHVFRTLDRQHR